MAVRTEQYTPEEEREKQYVLSHMLEALAAYNRKDPGSDIQLSELNHRLMDVCSAAQGRLIEDLSNKPEDIIDTLKSCIDTPKSTFVEKTAESKEEFVAHLESMQAYVNQGNLNDKPEELKAAKEYISYFKAIIKEHFSFNFLSAYSYLKEARCPYWLIEACELHDEKHPEDPIMPRVVNIIKLKADTFYKCNIPNFEAYKWHEPIKMPDCLKNIAVTDIQPAKEYKVRATFPGKYTYPNDAIVNDFFSGKKEYYKEYSVVTSYSKKDKKKNTTATYIISPVSDSAIVPTHGTFTDSDRSFNDAVINLHLSGNRYIYPADVYRVQRGLDPSAFVKDGKILETVAELDKLRHTTIRVDPTKSYYGKQHDLKVTDDNVLHLRKYYGTDKDETTVYYELLSNPILYVYAELTKQCISIESKCLCITETIEKSPGCYEKTEKKIKFPKYGVTVRDYILRRIGGMKAANALQSNDILMQNLYNAAGYDNPDKTEASRIREFSESVLRYQQAIGEIKGFTINKKGKSCHSFSIEMPHKSTK